MLEDSRLTHTYMRVYSNKDTHRNANTYNYSLGISLQYKINAKSKTQTASLASSAFMTTCHENFKKQTQTASDYTHTCTHIHYFTISLITYTILFTTLTE